MYVDVHHNLGWDMHTNWILNFRNPRTSNLVRKNRANNHFSSRTKLKLYGIIKRVPLEHRYFYPTSHTNFENHFYDRRYAVRESTDTCRVQKAGLDLLTKRGIYRIGNQSFYTLITKVIRQRSFEASQ